MWTLRFWKRAADRAVTTTAATTLSLLGAGEMGILGVEWGQIGSVAALAFLISLLTSVSTANVGPNKGTPDLTE